MYAENENIRALSDSDAQSLTAGEEHYRSYVGPPGRYDLMGAMQFRLLATLGLRERHRVLDFGCGSLRAGRLLMAYLQPDCYFGIDPNRWLIEDGIDRNIGQDLIKIKRPTFAYNNDFTVPFRDARFDFILAQSVFSHTGLALAEKALRQFSEAMAPAGLIVATFSVSKDARDSAEAGWVYPECLRYRIDTILSLASKAGLAALLTPFFHPSQRWFILARDEKLLPPKDLLPFLTGAVFNVEEFAPSLGPDFGAGMQS